MNRRNWMLLFIAKAGQKGLSPIQLQKGLFLLEKEHPETVGDGYYEFEPYNYGPFDRSVYLDADVLTAEGYIESRRRAGQHWPEYAVTTQGVEYAAALEKETNPETIVVIERNIQWMRQFDFAGLVRAIYERFPEYKSNSVFQVD